MRISIVGAGVAGLTAALALQRDGHEVRVHEAASELRATGFGLNLWSNATTLLHDLGVDVPGEPFDRLSFRAGGRERAQMALGPRRGQPHVNAERGALLHAIHERLVPGTIQYGNAITGISNLADDGADLIVAADGIRSVVRPDVATNSRLGRPWTVWQAVLPDGADLLEPRTGVGTVGSTRFVGIFRHPGGELCWFLEEPGLDIGTPAAAVLARTATDEDPLVAEVARRTPPDRFVEWVARDRWPSRRAVAGNIVAIGDAAHPMLPCIGQGACTSIEDGVALAVALRQQPLDMALTRYRRLRLTKVRARVATAHLACAIRKPSPIATAVAATPLGVPFAHQSALSMRLLNRVDRRLLDTPLTGTSAGR